jgi:hypothetical protein
MDSILFYQPNCPPPQPYQNVRFCPFNVGASSVGKPTKGISTGTNPKQPASVREIHSGEEIPKPKAQHHGEDSSFRRKASEDVDLSVDGPAETLGTFDIRPRRYLRI